MTMKDERSRAASPDDAENESLMLSRRRQARRPPRATRRCRRPATLLRRPQRSVALPTLLRLPYRPDCGARPRLHATRQRGKLRADRARSRSIGDDRRGRRLRSRNGRRPRGVRGGGGGRLAGARRGTCPDAAADRGGAGRGVRRLTAAVLPENARMRGVFAALGLATGGGWEGGFVRIDLDLASVRSDEMPPQTCRAA